MSSAAKWLRRCEIPCLLVGLSLLGAGFAATLARSNYQARQLRALASLPGAEPIETGAAAQLPRASELDPLVFGRIEIPRLALAAIVREGVDDATLSLAVGHLPETARPGENGNAVLAGHRDTFFRELRGIRLNDRILLLVPPETYEYQVVATRVVAPDEVSVLASRGVDELTLITCYPFNFIGSAPNRFIVQALRVPPNSIHSATP